MKFTLPELYLFQLPLVCAGEQARLNQSVPARTDESFGQVVLH
jgi:hypothetical protein